MENKIKKRLEEAIADRVFPGAVVGVLHTDRSRTTVAVGNFIYDPTSPKIDEETIYDTASITKTIPVALLALTFIEQGKLALEDPVIKYIPEIKIPDAEKGLVKHLLTYTYMLKKNADPNFSHEHYENYRAKEIFEFLFTREFAYQPGTQYRYSNTPALLLGLILERIAGEKLYSLAEKMIFNPLEMSHSTFSPGDKDVIPPTEIISWRGEIKGEVHDDTTLILQKEGFNPGCAGLFSNASDLLNVAEMVLQNGIYKGTEIFNAETIALMTTNALSGIGQWAGIGWELNQPQFMGKYSHEHMIGKTGFTGTSIVIDSKKHRACVLLSNRTYPKRTDVEAIRAVRQAVADIVFAP